MVFLSLHSKSVKNRDSACKIDRSSSFVPLLHISIRLTCYPQNAIIYNSTIHVHCMMFDNNYYNETAVCLEGLWVELLLAQIIFAWGLELLCEGTSCTFHFTFLELSV